MSVKRKVLFLAAPLAAAVISPCVLTAFADYSYFEGKEAIGAVCLHDSSVILEEEKITLDVPQFPSDFTKENFGNYEAIATTEYTFSNPSDKDENLRMFVPVGQRPAYCGVDDSARYLITVDGEQADAAVRHSYYGSTYSFNQALPREEQDEFYRADLPVTEYVFTVTLPAEENGVHFLTLGFECNSKNTRVFGKDNPVFAVKNGGNTVKYTIREGGTYEARFLVIGERVKFRSPSLTKWEREGETQSAGEVSEPVIKESTFHELVFLDYKEERGVSEGDWFHAYVDMLNENTHNHFWVCPVHLSEENLLRWYEYTLHIPAGGQVIHKVQSPLYPSYGQTPQYEYSYLLSPAQRWQECKKVTIRINTPYYLYWSSLDFEREEGGYTFELDSLPQCELNFVMTGTAAEAAAGRNEDFLKPAMSIALWVLIIVIVSAFVVTVAVIIVINRLKKAVRERDEAQPFSEREDKNR